MESADFQRRLFAHRSTLTSLLQPSFLDDSACAPTSYSHGSHVPTQRTSIPARGKLSNCPQIQLDLLQSVLRMRKPVSHSSHKHSPQHERNAAMEGLSASECPACFQPLGYDQRVPYSLPCGHTLCCPCIKRLKKDRQPYCPLCHSVIADIRDVKVNLDTCFSARSTACLSDVSTAAAGKCHSVSATTTAPFRNAAQPLAQH